MSYSYPAIFSIVAVRYTTYLGLGKCWTFFVQRRLLGITKMLLMGYPYYLIPSRIPSPILPESAQMPTFLHQLSVVYGSSLVYFPTVKLNYCYCRYENVSISQIREGSESKIMELPYGPQINLGCV